MNILPKKRWHVRTRENIARVRKDEQEAVAEAEKNKQRVLKAEKEARANLLRQRAESKYGNPRKVEESVEPTKESSLGDNSRHVNFFEDLEEGKIVTTKANTETELEEKEKKEKYEKQIGYLTYLGQDTVEATGNIPWYEKVPNYYSSSSDLKEERNLKSKLLQDPLRVIKTYLPSEKKSENKISDATEKKSSSLEYHSKFKKRKHKEKKKKKAKERKRKCSSSSGSCSGDISESDETSQAKKRKSLDLLRVERLRREKLERERTEMLLNKINSKTSLEPKEESTSAVQQKYNSQYNPELAKQNYSKNQWNK